METWAVCSAHVSCAGVTLACRSDAPLGKAVATRLAGETRRLKARHLLEAEGLGGLLQGFSAGSDVILR